MRTTILIHAIPVRREAGGGKFSGRNSNCGGGGWRKKNLLQTTPSTAALVALASKSVRAKVKHDFLVLQLFRESGAIKSGNLHWSSCSFFVLFESRAKPGAHLYLWRSLGASDFKVREALIGAFFCLKLPICKK